MRKKEPVLGIKRSKIITKADSKVKAFVDIMIPTEPFGSIIIRGFRVIDGKDGLFVSLPNRASKTREQIVKDAETGAVVKTVPAGVKYYNDIYFENKERYNSFREELNRVVIPHVEDKLEKISS